MQRCQRVIEHLKLVHSQSDRQWAKPTKTKIRSPGGDIVQKSQTGSALKQRAECDLGFGVGAGGADAEVCRDRMKAAFPRHVRSRGFPVY